MGNRNRSWKGRGRGPALGSPSAESLFEQALISEKSDIRRGFDPRVDRKTLQLCRQVERALILALAGECGDEVLRDVSVESVEPAGGAAHLLVRVIVPARSPVMDVLARLNERVGKLRAIVAASICRKRTPMLSFIAISAVEGGGCD